MRLRLFKLNQIKLPSQFHSHRVCDQERAEPRTRGRRARLCHVTTRFPASKRRDTYAYEKDFAHLRGPAAGRRS
jgi:hypothetical protein